MFHLWDYRETAGRKKKDNRGESAEKRKKQVGCSPSFSLCLQAHVNLIQQAVPPLPRMPHTSSPQETRIYTLTWVWGNGQLSVCPVVSVWLLVSMENVTTECNASQKAEIKFCISTFNIYTVHWVSFYTVVCWFCPNCVWKLELCPTWTGLLSHWVLNGSCSSRRRTSSPLIGQMGLLEDQQRKHRKKVLWFWLSKVSQVACIYCFGINR